MNRKVGRSKWLVVALLVISGVVGIVLLAFSVKSREKKDKGLEKLAHKGVVAQVEYLPYQNGQVKWVAVGDPAKPKLLFIHGSPGDWAGWADFMSDTDLLGTYYMVAYDRMGYGGTTIPAEGDLAKHGALAFGLMKFISPVDRWLVVGHSYGGAVVAHLMATHPEILDKAVLIAPAVSPNLQEPKWYNKIARNGLVNKLIGKDWRASNVEMLGLSGSLRHIEPRFQYLEMKQVFIHGQRDMIVPFETVAYWQEQHMADVSYVTDKKMNHFVPWSHPWYVKDAILD
ncbi:MAG: alpha/beta hydrolase [Bacteroidetes bacterium]|nr:alpha/beta hydrolase [Bacteroidota bacterium]